MRTVGEEPNGARGWLGRLARPGDDLRHMMSGRCAILLAAADWQLHDDLRVAYLPAYTCETVSGCFVKLGYAIRYYDIAPDMTPRIDPRALGDISLFLTTGYYGAVTYPAPFLRACRDRGIGVIVDATHTLFSDGGVPPESDYIAASCRKWFPVACGGLAIKRGGAFAVEPEPCHLEHVRRRQLYLKADAAQKAEVFWAGETLLRQVYNINKSDLSSIPVVEKLDADELISRRTDNFRTLLGLVNPKPTLRPVFTALPEGACPSHFPLYAERRDELLARLLSRGIKAAVYWPVPPYIDIDQYPGARDIYARILTVPVDQSLTGADMRRIAGALSEAE